MLASNRSSNRVSRSLICWVCTTRVSRIFSSRNDNAGGGAGVTTRARSAVVGGRTRRGARFQGGTTAERNDAPFRAGGCPGHGPVGPAHRPCDPPPGHDGTCRKFELSVTRVTRLRGIGLGHVLLQG